MRASDLLGLEVRDGAGVLLGKVSGLRCIQDGPVRGTMALSRVDALIVHRRSIGAFLGYQLREEQSGPPVIRGLLNRVHRDARLVPWANVERWSADGIVTRAPVRS